MLIEHRKSENRFYFLGNRFSNLFICHFRQGDYIKITKIMSDKINSHICLILSVYKSFHRTVKNGKETMYYKINLGLKYKFSMMVSKIENRFKTGFQQPKTGLPKNWLYHPQEKMRNWTAYIAGADWLKFGKCFVLVRDAVYLQVPSANGFSDAIVRVSSSLRGSTTNWIPT